MEEYKYTAKVGDVVIKDKNIKKPYVIIDIEYYCGGNAKGVAFVRCDPDGNKPIWNELFAKIHWLYDDKINRLSVI